MLSGVEVLKEFVFGSLVPVEDVIVKLDEGNQLAVAFHDQGLVHAQMAVDDLLDLFGIDILSGRAYDHAAQASFDEETAFCIHAGQVSGVQPPVVGNDGTGAFGILVVAQHDVVAPDDDFAFSGSRIYVIQLDFDAIGRNADGTHAGLAHAGVGNERGALRHAVSDGIGEAGPQQEFFHDRVQFGTAHAKETQLAAKTLVQLLSHQPVQDGRHVLLHPGQDAALLNGGGDVGFIDLLDDERNGAHDGGPHLLHRVHEDGRSRRFLDIVHAGTGPERVEHGQRQFVGVRHGQDGQPPVFLAGLLGVVGFHDVLAQVPVTQHHAFGLSGRAGGINEGGQVVGLRLLDEAFAGKGGIVLFDERERFDVDDQRQHVNAGLAQFRQHALGNENGLAGGMAEDIGDLAFRRVGEDGHAHAAEGNAGEHGHCPVGHVLRQDGDFVAGADAEAAQAMRQLQAFAPESVIGISLASIDITGHLPFGKVLCRGVEELPQGIVEGLHSINVLCILPDVCQPDAFPHRGPGCGRCRPGHRP